MVKNIIILFLFSILIIAADSQPVMKTNITGGDEAYTTDVVLDNGVRKLAVLATNIIEQVFGKDPQGTTYFFFGDTLDDADGIGDPNDTIRVEIPAATTPLQAIYPGVDVTYTVTSADANSSNPERVVAQNVCAALEADANFRLAEWDCSVARDFAYVHIASDLYNEFGERTSYTVTCSGATTCNYGYADIARRGKETELARSPNDPGRLGVLSISGTVAVTPGEISDQFQEHALDPNGNKDMAIDGTTPVIFSIDCDPNGNDKFINSWRFWGGDNGIKYGQFLARAILSNGITIEVKSDDLSRDFLAEPLRVTEDFLAHIADPISLFRFDLSPAKDIFAAETTFDNPFPIRACGSFDTDDYIRVYISDNLSTVLDLEFIVLGFRREN